MTETIKQRKAALRQLFWGFLLQVIFGGSTMNSLLGQNAADEAAKSSIFDLFNSGVSGAGKIGIVFNFLALVGFVMIVVGMVQLRKLNDHYGKAFKYFIACFAFALIGTIIVVAGLITAQLDHLGAGIGIGAVGGIILLAIVVLDLLSTKHILYGNARVWEEAGDLTMTKKSYKVWRRLVLAFVILVIGGVISAVTGGVTLLGAAGGFDDITAGGSVGLLFGLVILAVGVICMLVVTIQYLMNLWKTSKVEA